MNERFYGDPDDSTPGMSAAPLGGDGLDGLRSRADDLAAAGDEIIRNALEEGDSLQFLRDAQQESGQ